jgi:hypothetical protein
MNAKRKPGRPLKMTPLHVAIIFNAIADGANITQARTVAGVHPSTYCKWAIRAGRRSCPRPKLSTLWAKGITRRDRLFLWYLAYRLPTGYLDATTAPTRKAAFGSGTNFGPAHQALLKALDRAEVLLQG